MALAAANMIAFADDTSVSHNDGSHHGVGACSLDAIGRQLQAAAHENFVVHVAKLRKKIVTFPSEKLLCFGKAQINLAFRSTFRNFAPKTRQ